LDWFIARTFSRCFVVIGHGSTFSVGGAWTTPRLEDGLAAKTINRDFQRVEAVLARAVQWKILDTHPLADFKPLKANKGGRVRYLSAEEESAVDNSWNGVANLEFAPETRVAMKVAETAKIALEEYDDFGPVSHFLPSSKQSHQLFAVIDKRTKWVEIEFGFGVGLTDASDHRVLKLILAKDL
jgi:hypothetical protein